MVSFLVGAILSATLVISAIPQVSVAAAISVVNQSSLTIAPDDPLTATIRQTPYGPQLLVGGLVAERISTGERLANAVIEIIVTQADGTPLWSGESFPLSPGKRIDWRVSVKPNGALDGTLIPKSSSVIARYQPLKA